MQSMVEGPFRLRRVPEPAPSTASRSPSPSRFTRGEEWC